MTCMVWYWASLRLGESGRGSRKAVAVRALGCLPQPGLWDSRTGRGGMWWHRLGECGHWWRGGPDGRVGECGGDRLYFLIRRKVVKFVHAEGMRCLTVE